MPMRSLRVRGRGTLEPSSFTKKAGGRSSGGASLSLSAPSSAIMRCRFAIFFSFFFTWSSAARISLSAFARAMSAAAWPSRALASPARASAASASAASARPIAFASASRASSRSLRACSASALAWYASFCACFMALSASRAWRRASSMRRTCSATSSFACSSSPSACASCACRISSSSSCRCRSSKRCRSLRHSTHSSWIARKQAWSWRFSRSRWIVSMRACARALRIFWWCKIRSRSFSSCAFHLKRMLSKLHCSQEETPARMKESSFASIFFWMKVSIRLLIFLSFTSPRVVRSATFTFSASNFSRSVSSSLFSVRILSYCACSSSTIDAPSVPACFRHSASRSKSALIFSSMACFRRSTSAVYFL
mmetsp:Transcript_27163/g.68966  ORF Transcript_27163/g.68966 Transcript_27163/m.68966 type:complete len:368 (+) Transcript_27163:526-1629(+)